MPRWTMRQGGMEMATMRPAVHITRETWEAIQVAAEDNGIPPEEWLRQRAEDGVYRSLTAFRRDREEEERILARVKARGTEPTQP